MTDEQIADALVREGNEDMAVFHEVARLMRKCDYTQALDLVLGHIEKREGEMPKE